MQVPPKTAVVHDWLVSYAGAERVLEQILFCFPDADLYSVVDFLPEGERGFLRGKRPSTTFIQKVPLARKKYRQYLPLMPWAMERIDLSGYDLVISSSHAVAKGVRKSNGQTHLSYIHTPMRYAWDLRDQYLQETGLASGLKGRLVNRLLDYVKNWDLRNTQNVDAMVANSRFIAERIRANYGREAPVIYPPVAVDSFEMREKKENFYLTASRFVPYKKVDLVVEAFSHLPDQMLVVIGDGPDWEKVKKKAGPNIELLGFQPSAVLKAYMQRAKAFLFAAEEDFGIAVVEAQACGTPVVALGRGGALETVRGLDQDRPTGVFFKEQSVEGLARGIRDFETHAEKIIPSNCRENALRFGVERFRREFKEFVHRHSFG